MELYNKENASRTVINAFDLEFEKGMEEGKREITKKLIIFNMALETIDEVTGLTLEKVLHGTIN